MPTIDYREAVSEQNYEVYKKKKNSNGLYSYLRIQISIIYYLNVFDVIKLDFIYRIGKPLR